MKLSVEYEECRQTIRKFVEREVAPVAHQLWRERREVPQEIIAKMAELDYFAILEDPLIMCVVTEELSRGWLAVGSIATRSIIAAKLIEKNGTPEQKTRWIESIATGKTLCAACFTEPDYGSDVASMNGCRARKVGGGWLIRGAKTWATMANRANLMTVLARTADTDPPHKGLSMFLIEKEPGEAFAPPGITATEIPTSGYYGLKEYEVVFEDLFVPDANLLGGELGRGFKQLMQTFEWARLQTAARAVGVAQSAYEFAVRYAKNRKQFGVPIVEHQVIRHKLARMWVELEAARALTYRAADALKDGGRHDRDAGAAKVFAAETAIRIAHEAAQIHGGYGFAEEYDVNRLERDARLLTLFEGTSEIQYDVIGKQIAEND